MDISKKIIDVWIHYCSGNEIHPGAYQGLCKAKMAFPFFKFELLY